MIIHYEPQIELGLTLSPRVRQVFSVSRIDVVEEEGTLYLQIAEDLEDTTIHSLLFALPLDRDKYDGSELHVEFNDQSNGMFGPKVGTVELSDHELILTPAPSIKLYAGRVSYASEADPFDGSAFFPQYEITQLVARFASREEVIEKVNSMPGICRITAWNIDQLFPGGGRPANTTMNLTANQRVFCSRWHGAAGYRGR